MRGIILFSLTLAALLTWAVAAAAQCELVAYDRSGNSVAVRPLDDPASPYLGQYSAWEELAYCYIDPALTAERVEQLVQERSAREIKDMLAYPPRVAQDHLQFFYVDAAGFIIPTWIEWARQDRELNMTLLSAGIPGGQHGGQSQRRVFSCWALVPFADAAMRELYTSHDADLSHRAAVSHYPPVPDWLYQRLVADSNLTGAVALSDGRWLIRTHEYYTRDQMETLWVSGFDASVDAGELYELFGSAGTVENVQTRTDYSAGYNNIAAVVTMASADAAQTSAALLNGIDYRGFELYVGQNLTAERVDDGYIEWFLYAADGRRIPNPHQARGTDWQDRTWPGGFYDTLEQSPYEMYPPSGYTNYTMYGGYVEVFDPATKELLAVYASDDGTLLYDKQRDAAPCTMTRRPQRYCEVIDSAELKRIYRNQQRLQH